MTGLVDATEFLKALTPVIAAVGSIVTVIIAWQAKKTITDVKGVVAEVKVVADKTHDSTNSKMTEMMALVKSAAFKAGELQARTDAKAGDAIRAAGKEEARVEQAEAEKGKTP